jgi:superfamily II DNA/RNA helicase
MRAHVQDIFIRTPKKKQTIVCSATMPPSIKPVIEKFLRTVRLPAAPSPHPPPPSRNVF